MLFKAKTRLITIFRGLYKSGDIAFGYSRRDYKKNAINLIDRLIAFLAFTPSPLTIRDAFRQQQAIPSFSIVFLITKIEILSFPSTFVGDPYDPSFADKSFRFGHKKSQLLIC